MRTPANLTLVENLSFALPPHAALLIRGRSGVGKTTLLRAIAGLWPHVGGTVIRPAGEHALFVPQKPYLPLGTLRTALYYPAAAEGGAPESEPGGERSRNLGGDRGIDLAGEREGDAGREPGTVPGYDRAADVLRQCQLAHLIWRLDEDADWTGILSLGEQQRLAIRRALLASPQVIFLDGIELGDG